MAHKGSIVVKTACRFCYSEERDDTRMIKIDEGTELYTKVKTLIGVETRLSNFDIRWKGTAGACLRMLRSVLQCSVINMNDGFPIWICADCIFRVECAYNLIFIAKQAITAGPHSFSKAIPRPDLPKPTPAPKSNKNKDIRLESGLTEKQIERDRLRPSEPIDPNSPEIDTSKQPLHCPRCKRTFKTLKKRYVHLVRHARERRYQCKVCDMFFTSLDALDEHAATHIGSLPYKFLHELHLRNQKLAKKIVETKYDFTKFQKPNNATIYDFTKFEKPNNETKYDYTIYQKPKDDIASEKPKQPKQPVKDHKPIKMKLALPKVKPLNENKSEKNVPTTSTVKTAPKPQQRKKKNAVIMPMVFMPSANKKTP